MLVYYNVDLIIISLKNNYSHDDTAEKLLSWCYTTITHSVFTKNFLTHKPFGLLEL